MLTPVSLLRAMIEQDEHAHRAALLRVWMAAFRGELKHASDAVKMLLSTVSPSP
jgi:hypothetical protein